MLCSVSKYVVDKCGCLLGRSPWSSPARRMFQMYFNSTIIAYKMSVIVHLNKTKPRIPTRYTNMFACTRVHTHAHVAH